ncbi:MULTISPECIES: hypothetical protein [unclassified Mesorhizobium]|uniref:hypothetical protein n=1 Tax=unclassified Mesorhizobium TaxID=325217 RepID=UPI001679007E|nr:MULTISPECIES: hypothetical protein [unclassified Mesorhizobium]
MPTGAIKQKAGPHFVQSGKVARSGEEKAGQVPAPTPTIEPAEKFRGKSIVAEKI